MVANLLFAELKSRLQTASELRDSIEHLVQAQYYPVFLRAMIPVILKLLEGPPVFVSTSLEQVHGSPYHFPTLRNLGWLILT